MENGKRRTENEKPRGIGDAFSSRDFSFFAERSCGACGAQIDERVGGASAKFCRICGKLLREDYQPLDRLRASYHLQGKSVALKNAQVVDDENLFDENKNAASETARACVVYSLVPYLGILFCPLALLTGGVGIFNAYRKPYLGGGKTSAYSIALTFLILCVQILLWWLLYVIPELGRHI